MITIENVLWFLAGAIFAELCAGYVVAVALKTFVKELEDQFGTKVMKGHQPNDGGLDTRNPPRYTISIPRWGGYQPPETDGPKAQYPPSSRSHETPPPGKPGSSPEKV